MPNVLIVEDDASVARALRDILEEAGYAVVGAASTAEDAFSIVERSPPRVAIMDVKLAGSIDGITLAQELVRRYSLGIVFVTGYPLSAWREARGITDKILAKPYSERELLAAVASACETPP